MSRITLSELKANEADRRTAAVATLRSRLADHARACDGRYLLFGSAARGTMRYQSDVDILLDFPADRQRYAWNFAERACQDLGLTGDIMPVAWCQDEFLDHIRPDLISLP